MTEANEVEVVGESVSSISLGMSNVAEAEAVENAGGGEAMPAPSSETSIDGGGGGNCSNCFCC